MRGAEIYDCIVVGIGGHGSSIAANLAKSGVKVLGLEQFGPVHSQGLLISVSAWQDFLLILCVIYRIFSWANKDLSAGLF